MATVSGEFELAMDELQVVTRYVAESAQEVLLAMPHPPRTCTRYHEPPR
ncbi:hypothetical protein BX264_7091 [Streptomyces sp. 2333.5]|nr:hypothetical protein BX264_7091 [Streptomyces sp. 2333.5]SEE96886.1 hypothetical protein SAMN05428943_7190 [Streptomyces sp. 2314.4]SEF11036.1 hypothetical protein SAMN05428942_7191 [Streptomyces sp. 2112.2]